MSYPYRSASGDWNVTPSARPRGTIETLRTGSAPGRSMPISAWPDSWYAVRSRSCGEIRMRRSAPRMIRSSESVKSHSSTRSWLRRAAVSAASLTRFLRSAPTMPDVLDASDLRSTSGASGTRRVCTRRICSRPAASGGFTNTRRSNRPGRSSAESRISGRFVAASTITPSEPVKPSISVRIWFSVCSRSSCPPSDAPPPRWRPIASSSSMKMIDGAVFFACSNRSRTRLAPTPTIISTNSEADSE